MGTDKAGWFFSVVNEETQVVLQGMSDTKYFSEFLQYQNLWRPASIGNNVIAAGTGIFTTLGALMRGEVEAVAQVTYQDAAGVERQYVSHSQSISQLPLVDLINSVISNNYEVMTHINLGAIEEESAWVNLGSVRTLSTLKTLFTCAFTFSCHSQPLPEQVLHSISDLLVKKQTYMTDTAYLEVKDAAGDIKGQAVINILD